MPEYKDGPAEEPVEGEEAYVEVVGGLVVLRTRRGALAVVSKVSLCDLAERFGLKLVNYVCRPSKHELRAKKRK